MQTTLQKPSNHSYQLAKKIIFGGGVVAFPTETIYGLGANAFDPEAVKKIFEYKGRPSSNPLIVHIGNKKQINQLGFIDNQLQQQIIDQLFPWPLTILLRKKDTIPEIVTANPFVGIRMPSNQVAHDFLETVGVPIAAPSANISGKPSPTSANMVLDNMEGKIPLILDGWSSDFGIESTVIKVDEEDGKGKIWILRPGFITKEDLELFFQGQDVYIEYTTKEQNMSPWTRFKHYSIDAEIHLITTPDELPSHFSDATALIATQEWLSYYSIPTSQLLTVIPRWTETNLASCAHHLFEIYHSCEKKAIRHVYIQKLPEDGLGFAIMNRVKRSAEK